MGLALSDDGDILYSETTGLVKEIDGNPLLVQNAMCELRCEQGQYFADANYGRSVIVWKLPTGIADKLIDVKRVIEKSIPVKTIEWKVDDLNKPEQGRIIAEV